MHIISFFRMYKVSHDLVVWVELIIYWANPPPPPSIEPDGTFGVT